MFPQLFVTISCGSVSEDSCCELKCRENRPVTAFKTLQKSHFLSERVSKLAFTPAGGKICCQVGSRWIKEEVLISREAIWFFSPGFELGAAADKKQTESCEEGGEDSLFTTSDMFSHKGKLSKQVTFSTSEKLFWPICSNISSASDAGGKVV